MSAAFIISFLVILAIIAYIYQSQRLHGPFVNFLIIVFLLAILLSVVFVYVQSDVDFSSLDGVSTFGKIYFQWWQNLFANGGKIVGYAVNQNWEAHSTGG